jgi:hypothetical protein
MATGVEGLLEGWKSRFQKLRIARCRESSHDDNRGCENWWGTLWNDEGKNGPEEAVGPVMVYRNSWEDASYDDPVAGQGAEFGLSNFRCCATNEVLAHNVCADGVHLENGTLR